MNESTAAAATSAGLEAIRRVLDSHIMFSVLPREEKQLLQPLFQIRRYAEGDLIAEQGQPTEGMYILYAGQVRLKQKADNKFVSLGTVEREGTLGEMSLVRQVEWPYQVVAAEPVTMMVLPAEDVGRLLMRSRTLEEHVKRHVSLIETSYRIRGLLGTAEYSNEQLLDILQNLGVKNVTVGQPVFGQGEEDPRLYYIAKGYVDIESAPLAIGETVTLDRAYTGDLIGESAALPELGNDGIHPHTARAGTDVTVLVVRTPEVRKICEINPGLHDRLLIRGRELKDFERQEIATRNRAEGVDQRVKLADAVSEAEFRALQAETGVAAFGLVRQGDESEAGLACLTMITNYYGKPFRLGQIRELTRLTDKTVTPNDIIGSAEVLGFRAKAYALKYDDFKDVKFPAIAGWESYHYVVVIKVDDKAVQIADPAGKIRTVPKAQFIQSWSAAQVPGVETPDPEAGVLIALDPTHKFERQETKMEHPIWHFIRYLTPYKKFFGEAFIAALVINVLGLASPLFVQTIVDSVVVHHDVRLLNVMLGGMVLVALFGALSTISQQLLLAHTTARIDMRLVAEFYQHVLSLPMEFFLKRNKGEILARFGENQKIRGIIAGSTITVLLNTLMVFLYFLLMFAYNITMTFIVMLFIPLYITIVLYFTPRIKAIAQEIFLTNAQATAHLIEALNGIEALKATANEYFARSRWENAFAENVNRNYRSIMLSLMSSSLFQMATLAASIVILWYGANEVIAGSMTIGELMGFNILMGLVTGPILQVVSLWNSFQEVRIAVDRVTDVLTVDPEREPVTQPEEIPVTLGDARGHIAFENVNFSYVTDDKTNYVMSDFNLEVQPGERVALVGPSGCGKSTIAKMVLGFHMPKGGKMLIDGKDLTTLDLRFLRRNIGVVLQDSFIFSGSVAENIALGDPQPDMQAVKRASRLAGADEFVVNYPLGYQTPIGEKGVGISGGQRQRICIARALYHEPRIIIFDEATSALDNESEERIMAQLEHILHNRTAIMIAHRLTTIQNCDRICFVKDGKVREMGSHKELLDQTYLKENGYQGLYYHLARTQFDLPPLEL
jgi:ATP-binding cassette subfamily B protein